jgi:hypothetical protein
MNTAKPSKDVIYLDLDDEITSIIDKVENSKSKIVALVLPKRATTLQSIVNMRLLKRSAEKAGKNVVLITGEAALLPLAGAAGLHVAKNLQSKPEIPPSPDMDMDDMPGEPAAETEGAADADEGAPAKIDYSKPIGELAAASMVDEESIPLEDTDDGTEQSGDSGDKKKPKKDKRLAVPNFERFRLLVGLGMKKTASFPPSSKLPTKAPASKCRRPASKITAKKPPAASPLPTVPIIPSLSPLAVVSVPAA